MHRWWWFTTVCACWEGVYAWVMVYCGLSVDSKGQLLGVGSLLPCEFQGTIGLQGCRQVSLLAEISCWS